MDFMTGVYLSAALIVLMAGGVTWFMAYWANQPGGVIEIGTPRWVMPRSVARDAATERREVRAPMQF